MEISQLDAGAAVIRWSARPPAIAEAPGLGVSLPPCSWTRGVCRSTGVIGVNIEPVLRDCRTRELAVSVLSCPEREQLTPLPITTPPPCGSGSAGRPSSTWAAPRLTPCGPWTCRSPGPHGTALEYPRGRLSIAGRAAVVAGVREL